VYSTSSTRTLSRTISKGLLAVAVAGVLFGTSAPVAAQDSPVTVTAGVDVPSLYYFRGTRQETDPKFTMWPWIDVGVPILGEGEGAVKSASLNIGLWNSLHTGSSGSGTDGQGAWYEMDFYGTLGLGFEGFSLATTYTAYTYPAPDFDPIHEIMFKASVPHMLAPYGLVAFEFADCEVCPKGTYAELGVGPSWPLTAEEGAPTLTVPVKIGLGLKDYYPGDDGASFGFASVGGTVAYAVNEMVSVKGGLEILMLGDANEALNAKEDGETSKAGFVGFFGIGFAF
jgi:hypothetical protein